MKSLRRHIAQLASSHQFHFGGKVCTLLTIGKRQLNLKLRRLCLNPLFSLSYSNITLLETNHDIVQYQVSDLIS